MRLVRFLPLSLFGGKLRIKVQPIWFYKLNNRSNSKFLTSLSGDECFLFFLWKLFIASAGFVLSLIEPRVNVSPEECLETACDTDQLFEFFCKHGLCCFPSVLCVAFGSAFEVRHAVIV